MRLTHLNRQLSHGIIAVSPLVVDDPGMLPRCIVLRALDNAMSPDENPVPEKYVVHEMGIMEDGKLSFQNGNYFHTKYAEAYPHALEQFAYRAAKQAHVRLPILEAVRAALDDARDEGCDGMVTLSNKAYNDLQDALAVLTGDKVGIKVEVPEESDASG